jgi:hypothetical protein
MQAATEAFMPYRRKPKPVSAAVLEPCALGSVYVGWVEYAPKFTRAARPRFCVAATFEEAEKRVAALVRELKADHDVLSHGVRREDVGR